MPLLQRVTTLIRANLNDLIDKAEDPEKMLKQLLLDLQNQYVQVKTQVAIAIADQHLLEKRRADSIGLQEQQVRRAQLALSKGEEGLARAALAQSLTHQLAASNFAQQRDDQAEELRLLREALERLEGKIAETKAKAELLIMQHRRAKATARAAEARRGANGSDVMSRAENLVLSASASGHGLLMASEPDAAARLQEMERNDQVERLLAELKARPALEAGSGG